MAYTPPVVEKIGYTPSPVVEKISYTLSPRCRENWLLDFVPGGVVCYLLRLTVCGHGKGGEVRLVGSKLSQRRVGAPQTTELVVVLKKKLWYTLQ